jgi:hypothetical protein
MAAVAVADETDDRMELVSNSNMPATDIGIDFKRFERLNARDRDLSMELRWRQVLDLVQLAADLEKASPDPDGIRRVREPNEAPWRKAIQQLIADAPR